MIAIVNYGLGNLHSVHKAVEFVGGMATVTDDPEQLAQAEKIILPGVGAFGEGMQGLRAGGFINALVDEAGKGKPLLGICLGMQLLFQESEELGRHDGLSLLPGSVLYFREAGMKIPQIGWNQVEVVKESPLLTGIESGEYFYFNHGYYCAPQANESILAVTEYGHPFASVVQAENVYGVQFHPEKSQRVGLKILENFLEI